MEDFGRNLVGCAVCGVHHDFEPLEGQVIGKSALAKFDVTASGVVQPAGTPKPIVDRYNATIKAMLARPDMREKLFAMGLDPLSSTPEEFAAFIQAEVAKWGPVVKASGAKVE